MRYPYDERLLREEVRAAGWSLPTKLLVVEQVWAVRGDISRDFDVREDSAA